MNTAVTGMFSSRSRDIAGVTFDSGQERLEEIIRRLDELKSLLMMFGYVQPNRQSAAED